MEERRQLRDKEEQLAEERRLSSNAQRQLRDKEQQLAEERRQLRDKEQQLAEERRQLSNAQRQLRDKEQELVEERRLSSYAQRQLRDKEQQLSEERRMTQQHLEDERHQRADENRRLHELLHETLEENRRLDAERLRFSDQCRRLEDRLERSTSLATQHSSSRQEADRLVKQRRLLEKARNSHQLIKEVWFFSNIFRPQWRHHQISRMVYVLSRYRSTIPQCHFQWETSIATF